MRYGNAKAGLGPGVGAVVSKSVVRGEQAVPETSLGEGIVVLVEGGGSIAESVEGAFEGTTGSGRSAIASSADEVSSVI